MEQDFQIANWLLMNNIFPSQATNFYQEWHSILFPNEYYFLLLVSSFNFRQSLCNQVFLLCFQCIFHFYIRVIFHEVVTSKYATILHISGNFLGIFREWVLGLSMQNLKSELLSVFWNALLTGKATQTW